LQAKAAKLNVPAKSVIRAVDAIMTAFHIVPFYEAEIVEAGQKLRKTVSDYIDCMILATAIAKKEELVSYSMNMG
jgi:predicted nucleic acid-binding protein